MNGHRRQLPQRRGGPQRIPRPADARPGGPPPWAEVPVERRHPGLDDIRAGLEARGAGRHLTDPARPARRHSAVLVPLYAADDGVRVVLTRRAQHLRTHTGEIAFPGGGHEEGDPTLWHTALREADEEIGLDPATVRRLGELDRFVTVSSESLVHPYVAEIEPPGDRLRPDPGEVETILHVTLAELMSDEVYREELWPIGGALRPITFFELHGDTVWGATASMLRQLLSIATGTDRELWIG